MILTFETMRADIARIIGEEPEAVEPEESLIDLGLDSMRAMMLVERWKAAGLALDFAELAEMPTLAHWWSVASRTQAGA